MLDVDAEAPELRALASYYAARGGALWIAPAGPGRARGMIAAAPASPDLWEICRVYVHPDHHGTGLAARLLALAERHAASHGAKDLFLWSDTRFARAHRFYEKHGYRPDGHSRDLHDLAATAEHRFVKTLAAPG